MKLATLTLTVLLATSTLAQETSTATTTGDDAKTTTATTTSAESTEPEPGKPAADASAEERNHGRYERRSAFYQTLDQYPYELTMVVRLDPGLLSNQTFLVRYPELQKFLVKNPEIVEDPQYYLGEIPHPRRRNPVEEVVEMLAVLGGFALATFVVLWLIRTIIEQRRWNRLSKTQAEVHNKILDRFGSSEEVLAYMQTAAGTKFLESAPIPLEPARPAQPAPFSRVMWSIQIGVIIAMAAFGMILVSFGFEGESRQGLFAMGAIAFSIGAGFIASALVSLMLSRRLGLWQDPASKAEEPNPSLVR